MGIKNIHIALISASIILSVLFGLWSLTHAYQVLGCVSLLAGVALVFYGINFIKKVRAI